MGYKPRSDRTRWAVDQIVAALRAHGDLTTAQLAETIGCRMSTLVGPLVGLERSGILERIANGFGSHSRAAWWRLGANAPKPVDVERFEPFPMSDPP